jgi:ubiquinone biosynthesis monooxygenase Coq7
MIRVNHAGEYGAICIYEGQLAVFKCLPHKHKIAKELAKMAQEEAVHLAYFTELINARCVRPTALEPVWGIAGFMLGAATALFNEKTVYACTEAVETVINEHYTKQVNLLDAMDNIECSLRDTIEKFRLEEIRHRDAAVKNGAKQAPFYSLLSNIIMVTCRIAIKLSERA